MEAVPMEQNVGIYDKTFRIILGVVIVGLGVYYGSWWGALGFLPLLTAIVHWCPIYLPLGVSTSDTVEKT